MATVLVCEGQISLVDDLPYCDTGWTVSTHVPPFQISDIDPAIATGMFGAGFALFIVPWAAAWGAKQLLSILR